MTDINSFSNTEPEYVKEVIPISYYALDECWIDPNQEFGTFVFPVEYPEYQQEPEFVKMVIPISAYEEDEHLSYRDFEPDIYISMLGKTHTAQMLKPDQPGAMM